MRSTSLDRTLIALSDPTRRAILERLSKGEARVTEIAERFPISLNSVSKHIKLLERARLVERHIEGRDHFLRISTESLDAVSEWIDSKRSLWKAQLLAMDELLSSEDGATRAASPVRKRGRRNRRAGNENRRS